MTLTVWTNQAGNVRLHQLSRDPEDGTVIDQVAYLVTLDAFSGWSCVSTGYQGSVPDADPSLWRWGDQGITAVLPVPPSISRRQCAKQLYLMGMITGPEAVAMTRDGTPPAMVAGYLAQLPDEQRFVAEMDFAADSYYRNNPLLLTLMAAQQKIPEEVDQFFIEAANQ